MTWDIESGTESETEERQSIPYGQSKCLVVLLLSGLVGSLLVVVGVTCLLQPRQDLAQGDWEGPVQCVAISHRHLHLRDEVCGETEAPRMLPFLARRNPKRIHSFCNCTVCDVKVACGATSSVPNLVDGTLRTLPLNLTTQACTRPGYGFTGYYRMKPLTEMREVELAERVEQARTMDMLKRTFAPFFVGTGGLAVLASLMYAIYSCISAASEPHPGAPVSYPDCWRSMPPRWQSGSNYTKVKYSTFTADDCCHVCLSETCGKVQFVGCGHSVVCMTCSGLLQNCPLCAQEIKGVRLDENMLL